MIGLFLFIFIVLLILGIVLAARDLAIQKEGRELQRRVLEAKKKMEDKKRELGIKEDPNKKRRLNERKMRRVRDRMANLYWANEAYGDNIPDYVVDDIMLGLLDSDPFMDDFEDDFDDW